MSVTIEDLADRLGVSRSTVSKALNDRSDVSDATKARVVQEARELGYQPSAAARSLRRRRTDKIGLVVNYPIYRVSPFLAELIPGMATAAEDSAYNLILYTSLAGNAERVKSLCRSRELDGIVIAWPQQLSETIALSRLLTEEEMPHVFLPRRIPHKSISYMAADHVAGARQLTAHLIEMGHRRIGFVRLPELFETDHDRHEGYAQALKTAGIAYDSQLVISSRTSEPAAAGGLLSAFLSLVDPPTAILFFTDPLAIRALSLAKAHDIRVPDDLSIAGFDGILSSGVTVPALTTVRQPMPTMGERAVNNLLKLIAEPDHAPIQEILSVEFIARDSTGPAKIV